MKPVATSFLLIIFFLNQCAAAVSFFDRADTFFKTYVRNGLVDYALLQQNAADLQPLIQEIAQTDLRQLDANTKKAFYINAYNLLVVQGVLKNYPIASVLKTPNFFDVKQYTVGGKQLSLNELEKEWLLAVYKDPRLHFVLVCGAIGCPPITNFAYRPAQLDAQLEQQTQQALNDSTFIRINEATHAVVISQIFEWYGADFGGSHEKILQSINRYRTAPIPMDYKVTFYEYDWSLNETKPTLPVDVQKSNNNYRYVVSSVIPKGSTETKIFNNLYTQTTGNRNGDRTERANFFTTFISSLYGLSNRLNVGLELRYRQATYDPLPASPLEVFRFEQSSTSRFGVTTIGPKIRYAPSDKLPNFSIQSAFWLPLRNDWEGSDNRPYLDWNNPTWWTQFFNDFSIGERFALFAEIDALWEDIGNRDQGALNRFSTPVTLIGSYFPTPKTTLYLLTNYSPYWSPERSYFWQAGVGTKYQFTPKFEVEALYTYFTNEFLSDTNGRASTFNVGIRFNR